MRHSEIFNPAYTKMKATLFAQITPSSTNAKWDQNEMKDVIKSAKSVSAMFVVTCSVVT